ncbi:MAG: type I secretion C-terminal target domain-containing protein [Colwellia sp.]
MNSTTVSEFEYEFTLIEGIDQLDENGDNLESILFDIVVSVTDGDNDVTDQNLTIEVSDSGAATITVSNDDFEVTETPNTSVEDATISDSDSITITIEADQDPIVDIKLAVNTKDPVLLSDGTTLTQNGETVYWQASSDGNYQGVLEDGTVIFELTLPENINISAQTSEDVELEFTLVGSVDHDKDSGHDDSLKITLPVVVIDSDGTEVGVDINVTIEDGDIPSLSVSDSLVVDEGDLLAGNGISESEITYELVQGSDDVVAVEPVLAGQVIDGLTSNGQSVSFAETADSNGWWIASSNEGEVFKVRFNLDGTIEFKLLAAVDHLGDNSEELTLSLDIQAIDADGDVSELANVNINIIDDVPESQQTTIVIEEGQSETLNLLEDPDSMGADGATITSVSVWEFDTDGEHVQVTYNVGETIILRDSDGDEYGTITINADGTGTLTTDSTLHSGGDIIGLIEYTVTDSDGDEVDNSLVLDIADEAGKITISNTNTLEDESLLLDLVVSVGDVDEGEQLVGVVFMEDSLAGGTLTLNGVLLVANEDGEIILSADDFVLLENGTYVPKGDLVYHPELNSSDATQEVSLDIYAEISRTDGSENEIVHNEIDLSITSVADKPTWDDDNSTYEYTTVEDGDEQEIALSADLFDTDGSETLTYQIGDIDSGLILTINGVEISSGDVLSAEEIALIKVSTEKNVAGVLTFAITPIATEGDNHDVALGDEKIITINVQPVADVPDLVVKDVQGLEDEIVLLNEILNGQLNDNDGSETLSYIITVPEGWSVVAVDGDANVIDLGNGTYQVLGSDVESGAVGLLPEANASSSTGEFIFSAQAVATESSQDGIDPSVETAYSEEKEFEVFLQGVADIPIVTPGEDWTFDETTRVIRNEVALEDSLVSLAIDITTADQDGSESINLLLSNLPDGVIFTDSQGNEVQLSIVSIVDGKPVYQVTLEQLQDLYLKPEQDFSGLIEFNIETIVTEADGDAQRHGDDDLYNIIVEIDIQPVVDNDSSTINLTAEGKEDLLIALDFVPEEMADIDGSEVITAFIITGLEPGMTLYFDGEEITDFPVDLADYIDGTSGTLLDLMGSERFSVQAPTDATGNFKIDITYEITDTSGSGATASATFDDTMNIHVEAEVEDLLSPDNTDIDDITRLEADHSVQSSNDGSPISLEGLVDFYDADSDGSEVVDYIVIVVPAGEGWVITHPNGAISDGEGRWFIPATGLTSTNIQEVAAELLAGATIYSSHSSLLPSVVTIGARVVDGNDELMIADNIYVHFSGNTSNSSASDTSDLTNEVINGVEDENIDIGGQISNSVAGDGNDLVSFKILASDLPEGGVITGFDVIAVYDTSGKILLQYVFTEASLESLQLVGIRDDFSGTFELPITVIATDSDSGDTRTEDQVLEFEITPVVDGVELIAETTEILEDTFTELNLSACFEDSNITGEGVETITSLTLTLPEGGFLSAPDGVLTDNGDGTWTVNDLTRIDEILYKAPLNFSGDISIGYTAEVTDTAEGYNGTMTDTGTSSGTIDIEVLPVTDGATISTGTEPSQGDEDTYIDIEGLSVNLIDDDGSELMSIVITGVPEGAILVWDGGTILPNNGPDGGTFNGEPTYQWTITAEQLASLAIKPGRDFSGDITLTITVIAYEQGTSDYVTTEETFVVEVLPVGDDVQFTSIEDEFTGTEGQETYFDVSGETTETSGNETLRLTVRIAVTENSAGLVSIRIADQEAFFVEIDGYYVAILDIDSSELEGFYLNSGDAWGLFDVEIGLQSVDTATVGGEKVTDYGDITIFDSSVDLTPVVGVPELTLEADSVYVVAGSTSPLGIDLTLINPADGEIGYVEISGLPDGVSITNGTESDGVWTLSQEDLEDAQLTGLDDVGDFDLTVVSVGELDGETVAGNEQTIEVNVITDQTNISGDDEDNIIVAGAGDNVITGGEGDDQFVFNDADKGTTDAPANDSITDFTVGSDSINLTDLLRSVDASTGDELEMVLDLFEDESGSTIISVMLDGSDTVQNITLDNISLDDLYGGDASGVSESDILTKLIEDQTLITGQE